jgi:hypothetical protein
VLAPQRLDVLDLKALHVQVVKAQQRDGVTHLKACRAGGQREQCWQAHRACSCGKAACCRAPVSSPDADMLHPAGAAATRFRWLCGQVAKYMTGLGLTMAYTESMHPSGKAGSGCHMPHWLPMAMSTHLGCMHARSLLLSAACPRLACLAWS